LEKTLQRERRRRLPDGPRKTGWRVGYLGTNPRGWVRAAIHAVHGANGWKTAARSVSRAWGLGLLLVANAWLDRGDMSFGEALGRSVHDALFLSPHQPRFGESGGPFVIVAIVIAAAGVVTALFSPVALNEAMTYPLSRRQRAQVLFRGGLVDGANLLFIVGCALFVVGHVTGWLVGIEVRFDFMPFFFRVLMVTVILMPLAHWGRIRLQAGARRGAENAMIGVIAGVIGFVAAVGLGTAVSSAVFGSPIVELGALSAAILVSQLIYRHMLTSYYRTADLA